MKTFIAVMLSGLIVGGSAALAEVPQAPVDRLAVAALEERPAHLDRLRSLVVAVEGEVVFARVYEGPGLSTPVNIKSLSKTVLAAVVGAAVDREVVSGMDQPVTEWLEAPEQADERLQDLTLGQLLSLQAGLERTSGSGYGPWVNSDNWVDYALSRPFVDEPGGRMLYSTGSTHVLGAALVAATGESLLTLTRRWLGEPLSIAIPDWPRDPQGMHFGGNDMRLSPLALLAIGDLYRNRGTHNGEQVLSADWIEASWTARGRSRFSGDEYGYGWFLTELDGVQVKYGRGFGGQMLYVVPELHMTVVMTADASPPGQPGFMRRQHQILAEEIIPAVRDRGG